MTKKEAKAVLVAVFRSCTKAQRDRLLYHANAGTRINCGERYYLWAHDGAG